VAENFVTGYALGLQVDHIDKNKSNNNYTNLEWVTPQENVVRRYNKNYICTHIDGTVVLTRNLKQFAIERDLSQGNLQQVATHKRKQHKGWRVEISNL
tara:strand:+ start:63 stop:356 length:294 start_codon:yes stop_codon:yes gene_type:complete